VARVASEFREMPGLSVTLAQAARLFDLSRDECSRVLIELQRDGVVELTQDGCYRTPPGH
jgi:DNA-binding IclR family transcriptional regulator